MSISPNESGFNPLHRQDQLDTIVERSFDQPILIFKHSPACGTSAFAYDELEGLGDQGPLAIHLVDVLDSRPLSQEIARRFRVHHQSPQVLLVRDGEVRWHASHYGVTAARVIRALELNAAGQSTHA